MNNRILRYPENSSNQFLYEQMQGYNLIRSVINQELVGLFNTETLSDMAHILQMYKIYFEGADFIPDSNGEYVPANWHSKQIRTLINKEARFLFSNPPDIKFIDTDPSQETKDRLTPNETLLNKVLSKNNFNSKLIRAAKDCLIGKRIAIVSNFSEDKGIDLVFVPSLEFVYETDPSDVDVITKFIQFYNVTSNEEKNQQRVYKKKWYMENGVCRVVEELYDGNGNLIETLLEDQATLFTHIPVSIVINEGLSGDPFGQSECESLDESESWYSKLSNKDIDSLRKGTDQITYTMDVDPQATKGLSRAPGALWDLQTDPAQPEKTGQVGTLDNPMGYSVPLDTTLNRLRSSMYSELDIPDTTNEALRGIITSGKAMKAIYWGLITRCNEKMLDWSPALRSTVDTIIEGCVLYPEIYKMYNDEELQTEDYYIMVDNNYPIMEDDIEEKASDMSEVNTKVMSRKAYMKKWRNLTDEEAELELKQIQKEKELLEQESYPAELELE